jgi:hypothetical protein
VKKGLNILSLISGGTAGAVVANPDLNFVTKVPCRDHQGWLTCIAIALLFAGILPGLRIDLYRPRMLLHNDVVSDGQAKAGPYELGCGDLAAMAKPGTVVKF